MINLKIFLFQCQNSRGSLLCCCVKRTRNSLYVYLIHGKIIMVVPLHLPNENNTMKVRIILIMNKLNDSTDFPLRIAGWEPGGGINLRFCLFSHHGNSGSDWITGHTRSESQGTWRLQFPPHATLEETLRGPKAEKDSAAPEANKYLPCY